jgi:hypothetical protein
MKICNSSGQRGFALVSTLLFLPLALTLLVFSVQFLFFNKVKNELLQDCFLKSLERIEVDKVSTRSKEELNTFLDKKFKVLNRLAPLNFFVIDLKFETVQTTDPPLINDLTELATHLQLSVLSKNINFKSFRQNFKCGAFIKWKNSKKSYGIIAVKY